MAIVRTQKKKHYRGAMTVEAAIVFPLLLLLTLGAIRYGWLFLKAEQITNAARMGARIAVLPNSTADTVNTAVNNLMIAADINPGDCTVLITPEDIGTLDIGDYVTVRVSVPGNIVDIMPVPLLTELDPNNWSLSAEVTMAKEGY